MIYQEVFNSMMHTYTKQKLYDIAKENYLELVRFCNILDQEGYWEQAETVLKMTIYECLDWYVEAVLIQLAVNFNMADTEQRKFIYTISRFNTFDINEENEISKTVYEEAVKAVLAPPVLLQLCGLRDNEKSSGLAGLFFDALLNIILIQTYLSSIVNSLVVRYITELYKRISVFLYSVVENSQIIDEKYIFYKISNTDLEKSTNGIKEAGDDFNSYKNNIIRIPNKKRGSISRNRSRDFINKQEISDKLDCISKQEISDELDYVSKQEISDELDCVSKQEVSDKQEISDKQDLANKQDVLEKQVFADKTEEIQFRQYMKNKLSRNTVNINRTKTGAAYEEEDSFKQYIGNYEEFEDSLEHNERLLEHKEELNNTEANITDEVKAITTEAVDKTKTENTNLSKADVITDTKTKDISQVITEVKQKTRLDELLTELNGLIGLTEVKKEINSLINLIKVKKMREKHNLPVMDMSYHMVFTGNPGTGKTTVARLVAEIYREIGLLSIGSLLETDRAGLVAGFVGQTAIKVTEVVDKAIGGVLFIDEAYSLSNSIGANDFGGEAIDTLVKLMEDHRDDLVIIAAGYTKEMEGFLKSNTGLVSRFNKYVEFPDYTVDELIQILNSMSSKSGFDIEEEAITIVKNYLQSRTMDEIKAFGNARGIRNMFEKMVMNHANRIVECLEPTISQLTLIQKDDVFFWKDAGERGVLC